MSRTLRVIFALLLAIQLSACAKLMNNLRRDLDDSEPYTEPTVGGRWSERGFLSEDMPEAGMGGRYASVGHSERSPASSGQGDVRQGGWIDPDQASQNRRDRFRGQSMEDGEQLPPSFSGTAALAPPTKRAYRNGGRATRGDFVDYTPNEGSLWASDGQTNYYFTKNKVRGIGDIVTITVEPELFRDMVTEVRRTLAPREREAELALAQERIRRRTLGLPPLPGDLDGDPKKRDSLVASSSAPSRDPAADGTKAKSDDEVEIPKATSADIDLTKTLEVKAGDTMMGEVLERYPNGNYKIRGIKKVLFKSGAPRLMNVTAIVRGTDITEEDTLTSGKFYEYRLEALREY